MSDNNDKPPRPDFWQCMSAKEQIAVIDAERWYLGRVAEMSRRIADLERQVEEWRSIALRKDAA